MERKEVNTSTYNEDSDSSGSEPSTSDSSDTDSSDAKEMPPSKVLKVPNLPFRELYNVSISIRDNFHFHLHCSGI